jgi:hypothetical protein
MVMLIRSLRAVLRKESCMFCAGLFSIADLLCLSELQIGKPLHKVEPRKKNKHANCARSGPRLSGNGAALS